MLVLWDCNCCIYKKRSLFSWCIDKDLWRFHLFYASWLMYYRNQIELWKWLQWVSVQSNLTYDVIINDMNYWTKGIKSCLKQSNLRKSYTYCIFMSEAYCVCICVCEWMIIYRCLSASVSRELAKLGIIIAAHVNVCSVYLDAIVMIHCFNMFVPTCHVGHLFSCYENICTLRNSLQM